jgi:hypothetical protein
MAATADLQKTDSLAYMDIDAAPQELKEKILEARNQIIFSKDWTYDGSAFVIDLDSGEIVEKLPMFADLFPSDWNPPVMPVAEFEEEPLVLLPVPIPGLHITYLNTPPSNTMSTPFTTEYATSSFGISTKPHNNNIPGSSWNCGYSNSSGVSLTWKTYLASNRELLYYPPTSQNISVRASTYSITGNATLNVVT